jgi:hypothetical protein
MFFKDKMQMVSFMPELIYSLGKRTQHLLDNRMERTQNKEDSCLLRCYAMLAGKYMYVPIF